MNRILVTGSSGAGKTTLARRLASLLELPYVEFDSLFHGPGWTQRPEFVADVDAFTAQPRWVIDHDYGDARPLIWTRADTIVWLDYSRARCEWQVIRRTVPRAMLRRELWNGNRERFWAMFHDPEHPVRWSWSHHSLKRAGCERRIADPAHAHLTVVRLMAPKHTRAWLRDLRIAGGSR